MLDQPIIVNQPPSNKNPPIKTVPKIKINRVTVPPHLETPLEILKNPVITNHKKTAPKIHPDRTNELEIRLPHI